MHLVVSSESRGDPTAVIPEDPGTRPRSDEPGPDHFDRDRLRHLPDPRSIIDVVPGAGEDPPPPSPGRGSSMRAPSGSASSGGSRRPGFGTRRTVSANRTSSTSNAGSPPHLLRWSNYFSIEEKNKDSGGRGDGISLLHKLSPKSAITFSAASRARPARLDRAELPDPCRYRRNVWRKWLFLEAEPDIQWPRKEDGSGGRCGARRCARRSVHRGGALPDGR